VVWNETSLDRWLTDPHAMVPGTKMTESVRDPAQRRMIIDFLKGRPTSDVN
jgi:cytochrome c2